MKYLCVAGLLLIGLSNCVFADETSTPANPAPTPIPTDQVLNQAESVCRRLHGIEADLSEDEVVESMGQKFDRFESTILAFYKESSKLLDSNPSLDRIRWLENAWTYIADHLGTRKDGLVASAKTVEVTLADLDKLNQVWNATLNNVSANEDIPPEVTEHIRKVLSSIENTRKKVVLHQDKILALQTRVTELDTQVNDMLAAADEGRKRAIEHLLDRNIPPVWNANQKGGPWFSRASLEQSWTSQTASLRTYSSWQQSRFLVHAIVLTVLIVLMYALRNYVRLLMKQEINLVHAGQIFERPISIAFLMALIASSWIYPMEPRLLTAFIGAFILVPTVTILRRLLTPRLYIILNALVIFYFVDQLRLLLVSLTVLSRVIFLTETFSGILFLLYLLRSFRRTEMDAAPDRLATIVRVSSKCAGVLLIAAFLANIFGYGHLSYLLRNGVMRSAYASVMFYAALEVVSAMVLIGFHIPPMPSLGMIKRYEQILTSRINFICRWAAILLWIGYTLDMFSLWTPLVTHIGSILSAEHEIGSHKFNPATFVMVGLAVWGSFLLSQFLRFALDADVYPRLRLPHGVPYAISTMLHYVILLAAFLGAAMVLNFDMTNVTILVSALGVGIGFGLQNIINNFLSGLILLFERPIKIGDSIQIGDATGIVQQIGIRASVLLTPNGSRIIVPNGTLVSDRVTNWTSSERRRIIVIPIDIERGGEPAHIMEILKREAALQSAVAKQPAPEVLITDLGATYSFEVRAWTEKVEEWNRIRSDLTLAINKALSKENIPVA